LVLSNGLVALLAPDDAVPVVSLQIFYGCGSVDEGPGGTGISHLLEHMMFNGSARYPGGTFDLQLEAAGGSSNAYTWKDLTAYYESFPPTALDLVFDMEADRMRGLAITSENLEQERGIVAEERRYAVENDNEGALWEALVSLMFQAHPYRDPVLGWMADIQGMSLQQLQQHYERCYAPANALIVMAGSFDPQQVGQALEASFGGLEPGQFLQAPRWVEPEQQGMRYAELRRPAGQVSLVVGYVGPAAGHEDLPALELLDHALSSGRASLLTDQLVYRQALLTDVYTALLPLEQASMFLVGASLADGVAPEQALQAIDQLMAGLGAQPLEPQRLERALRQSELALYRELETVEGRADALGTAELQLGGAQNLLQRPERWRQLTPQDLQGVAQRWLASQRRNVVVLLPLEPELEEPPVEEPPAEEPPAEEAVP